jgi:serine phosphatase RsbU (regulator of sigma subunit)
MRIKFFILLPFFFFGKIKAELSRLDSLLLKLNSSKSVDTVYVNDLIAITNIYLEKDLNKARGFASKALTESGKLSYYKGSASAYQCIAAIRFHSQNFKDALFFFDRAIELAHRHHIPAVEAMCQGNKCLTYYYLSEYNKAIECGNAAIEINKKLKNRQRLVVDQNNMGLSYEKLGELEKAVALYSESQKISEQDRDSNNLAICCNRMASLQSRLKDYVKAKENFTKALEIHHLTKNKKGEINALGNLGYFYGEIEENKKALEYYLQALDLLGNSKNLETRAYLLGSIGYTYLNLNDFDKAIRYTLQAKEMKEKMGVKGSLANTVHNLGAIYEKKKDFANALKCYNECVAMCIDLGDIGLMVVTYEAIGRTYNSSNNCSQALTYLTRYNFMKDSINSDNANTQLQEMNVKYESEKKEREILGLASENKIGHLLLKKEEEEVKRQNLQKIFFGSGFVLMLALAFFIFRGLKQQRLANTIISEQKKEVEHQKEIVEEKQKEIVDSINYAKRIQLTLLAHKEMLDENLGDHFVMFRPKDIVSGDFYWATKKDDLFFLAVCDSTGHGVPGAFMCLLNIGFLSEAINENHIHEPNKVLDYVRERLIRSISKEGQKDGFDGIIACFNKKTGQITYASANNSPVLVHSGQYIELPGDRMPVGKGERPDEFKLFEVNYQKGDTLYLYTDGYADQFGGPKGKKFMYKKLNTLAADVSTLSIADQEVKLETEFNQWKGNLEQIDDVCMIGIKL